MRAQRPQHVAHHGEDIMEKDLSNVDIDATAAAARAPR